MNTPIPSTSSTRQEIHRTPSGFHRRFELPGSFVEFQTGDEISQVSIEPNARTDPSPLVNPAGRPPSPLLHYVLWILRHAPDQAGIEMDCEGWVSFDELYEHLSQARCDPELQSPADLRRYLDARNRFERFSFTATHCRANYGHSTSIFQPSPLRPLPVTLYHATASTNLPSIHAFGLRPGRRRFVQLTTRLDYAETILRGPHHMTILEVMLPPDGSTLHGYHSGAHVWLVDFVRPGNLTVYSRQDSPWPSVRTVAVR